MSQISGVRYRLDRYDTVTGMFLRYVAHGISDSSYHYRDCDHRYKDTIKPMIRVKNIKIRRDWNGLNPVERIKHSKKNIYKRSASKRELRKEEYE